MWSFYGSSMSLSQHNSLLYLSLSGLWCSLKPLTMVNWLPPPSSSCSMPWSCRFRTWEASAFRFSSSKEITPAARTPQAPGCAPSRRCWWIRDQARDQATKVCVKPCTVYSLYCHLWNGLSFRAVLQMLLSTTRIKKRLPQWSLHRLAPLHILCPLLSQCQGQAETSRPADKLPKTLEHVLTWVLRFPPHHRWGAEGDVWVIKQLLIKRYVFSH